MGVMIVALYTRQEKSVIDERGRVLAICTNVEDAVQLVRQLNQYETFRAVLPPLINIARWAYEHGGDKAFLYRVLKFAQAAWTNEKWTRYEPVHHYTTMRDYLYMIYNNGVVLPRDGVRYEQLQRLVTQLRKEETNQPTESIL